jgi:hypothetical protein
VLFLFFFSDWVDSQLPCLLGDGEDDRFHSPGKKKEVIIERETTTRAVEEK